MEENRDQEEYKHVCRLCNKRYPSGKSLGGHMRSHVIAGSYASVHKVKSNKALTFGNSKGNHLHIVEGKRVEILNAGGDSSASAAGSGGDDCVGDGGSAGYYGLRENPKKTWRVADSTIAVKQERVCKQCGKAFQSLKALCGHMSSHSYRERNFSRLDDDDDEDEDGDGEEEEDGEDEENSWASEEEDEEDKELVMESHSNNVVDADHSKQRSAKGARYTAITVIDSFSLANGGSSTNSEIEQEQEELAMSLIMLSRDSGHRISFNLSTESSDNNSVILEGRSSSTIVAKRKVDSMSNNDNNGNGFVKIGQVPSKKLKCVEMDNSDSGYFENGAKELESVDSVDGYARNYGIKKDEFEYASGYGVYDSEFDKRSKNSGNLCSEKTTIELGEDMDEQGNRAQLKKYLKNRVRSSSGFELYDRAGSKKVKNDHLNSTQALPNSSQKAGKYQCSICQRTFKTHQALGGHIITHRRDSKNANNGLRHHENGENGADNINFNSKSISKPEGYGLKIPTAKTLNGNANKKAGIGPKKSKSHCCPFCPKVFKSGQALGGHKRSHLMGCSSQDKADLIQSAQENPSRNHHPLLDLNLPAPTEEDGNAGAGGHAQCIPW